jgi:hypothetical protein
MFQARASERPAGYWPGVFWELLVSMMALAGVLPESVVAAAVLAVAVAAGALAGCRLRVGPAGRLDE